MALNIKNQDVEKLLDEIVMMTGESKTEAVRRALLERQQRLAIRQTHRKDEACFFTFLEDEIWAQIPADLLGKTLTSAEEDQILGYGELGI